MSRPPPLSGRLVPIRRTQPAREERPITEDLITAGTSSVVVQRDSAATTTVRRRLGRRRRLVAGPCDPARVLAERYARGGMSTDEYHERRDNLQ